MFFHYRGSDVAALKAIITVFGPQLGIYFIKDSVIPPLCSNLKAVSYPLRSN